MRTALALLAALALCLLPGCKAEQPLTPWYENAKAGVRFHPMPGWVVTEKAEEGCRFAVEASRGPDLRFLICESPPRPEILFTQNTFVACENVKEYIERSLKGIRPTCRQGGSGGVFGYDTLYARLLKSGDKTRVQFVDHLFMPVKDGLVQVMAYAVGDDVKSAHRLFDQNRKDLFYMMDSVRMR